MCLNCNLDWTPVETGRRARPRAAVNAHWSTCTPTGRRVSVHDTSTLVVHQSQHNERQTTATHVLTHDPVAAVHVEVLSVHAATCTLLHVAACTGATVLARGG